MTRPKLTLFAALAVCAWLTACGPTWYSIILTPNGPVMERTISQRFGPEELESVALLYSQDIDAETLARFEEDPRHKASLSGTFSTDMPADSHNRGVYRYCESPLGSAAVYTERFGGRHDLAVMLREQEKAFNDFWDVLLLQLDGLVGDSAGYAALRAFAGTTMRADMWDLVLELTVSDLGEDATRNLSGLDEMPDDATDKIMRTLHFLDARGYIPLQEALDITAGELDEGNWYPFAVKTLGQSVGRRMGMTDRAMPAAFEALMNYSEEQLEEELDPTISMEPLVEKALLFDLDLLDIGGDARDVTLYIPVKPYMTNGAWVQGDETEAPGNKDAETSDTRSYVEWQYPLASVPPGGDLAQVVYAFWAEPDEAYQVEHFGSLIVDGDLLAEQCRWRQMLGPSLRDEWDVFLDGLRPGPELADTLRGFLFSIEETAGADDPVATRSRIARHVSGRLASGVESARPKDDEGQRP